LQTIRRIDLAFSPFDDEPVTFRLAPNTRIFSTTKISREQAANRMFTATMRSDLQILEAFEVNWVV
jgi:hypothetical protein